MSEILGFGDIFASFSERDIARVEKVKLFRFLSNLKFTNFMGPGLEIYKDFG